MTLLWRNTSDNTGDHSGFRLTWCLLAPPHVGFVESWVRDGAMTLGFKPKTESACGISFFIKFKFEGNVRNVANSTDLTKKPYVRYNVHMKLSNAMSITEARKRIFEINEAVNKKGEHFMLIEKGKPSAVIMSAREYESWAETLEVLSDFPNAEQDLKNARRDYEQKKCVTIEEVRAKYARKK
jgi:prevent-host-death family protein